ncbi:hypothetical protein [Flavobacterium aquidurense]|uniref:hypothetical protein n=1 Tax=Flavobacterium aquidurense TaxID=362413 RepID=UPI0028608760|nr:hypothetical protein [Flavobacterium aquidurense]MDR7371053.1 hypothetical protein [Flavobacterium aquidurense]
MLTTISWSNYIIAITVLMLFWYLFLGLRFYKTEFNRVLSGQLKIRFPALNRNHSQVNEQKKSENLSEVGLSSSMEESFSTVEDAQELSDRLIIAIAEHSQSNLSKEEFTNYIRLILSEYPFVKSSSLRQMINKLLVSESGKNPQIIMTYNQADVLWDSA